MNPKELFARIPQALRDHYEIPLFDHVMTEEHENLDSPRILSFDAHLTRLAQDLQAIAEQDPGFVQDLIEGKADAAQVYARFQQIESGNAIALSRPMPFQLASYAIPDGHILIGSPAELLTRRGKLSAEGSKAVAAFVVSPSEIRGLPRLERFARIFIGGVPQSNVVTQVLHSGLTLYATPYTLKVATRLGQHTVQENLLSRYSRAVATVRDPEEFRQTFAWYKHDLLQHLLTARVNIAAAMMRTHAHARLPEDPATALVEDAVHRTISDFLRPLGEQSSIASRAFMHDLQFPQSDVRLFVGAQIAKFGNAFVPIRLLAGILLKGPSPEEQVSHADIADLLSDHGLGVFFDLRNYLQFTYAYCDLIKRHQLHIMMHDVTPTFRSGEPIGLQFLIDEIVWQATQGDPLQLHISFFFDEPRQEIAVCYSKPQHPDLKATLEKVRADWRFSGKLRFMEDNTGVHGVHISGPTLGGKSATGSLVPPVDPSIQFTSARTTSQPLLPASFAAIGSFFGRVLR